MKKMKIIIIAIFTIFTMVFSSCSNKRDEGYFKHEKINTTFYVTEIYRAKHSYVGGYIIYNDIKVPVDNNGDGYYYKEYGLKIGDKIPLSIDVYYYSTYNGYELVFDKIDVSMYEQN